MFPVRFIVHRKWNFHSHRSPNSSKIKRVASNCESWVDRKRGSCQPTARDSAQANKSWLADRNKKSGSCESFFYAEKQSTKCFVTAKNRDWLISGFGENSGNTRRCS